MSNAVKYKWPIWDIDIFDWKWEVTPPDNYKYHWKQTSLCPCGACDWVTMFFSSNKECYAHIRTLLLTQSGYKVKLERVERSG